MKQPSSRLRQSAKRKSTKTTTRLSTTRQKIYFIAVLFFAIVVFCFYYRNTVCKYLVFKSSSIIFKQSEAKRRLDIRNLKVLEEHSGKAIGIDISEYQGEIE
jgi:lysozyme